MDNDQSAEIKIIEDLSLNAWPSHQMLFYDGWILRFSYFYTHRTNCVEQIGVSCLPLEEKIRECEAIYRRWGTPAIFKISPLTNPDLDPMLEARGYHIEHSVAVMTKRLDDVQPYEPHHPLKIEDTVSSEWIEGLFRMKEVNNSNHRRVVPQMYSAIPMREIAVSLRAENRISATGLGIIDRDYVGIYAIHVDQKLRRMGIARDVVSTILSRGAQKGAMSAYLQVVADNHPAKSLYRSLGFTDSYRCWFRVKEV